MKTLIQSIYELTAKGYQIDFVMRANGSPLIKSINGKQYAGFKGNDRARTLTKSKLTQAQITQKTYASRSRESYKKHQKALIKKARIQKQHKIYMAKTKPSQVQAKLLRKIQKIAKEEHKKFTLKTSTLRFNNKTLGRVKATQKAKSLLRYIQGYAYKENVYALIERLRKLDQTIFNPLIRFLRRNIDTIKENDISLAHNLIYDFVNANSGDDTFEVFPIEDLKDQLEHLFNIDEEKEIKAPNIKL